jgi:hypothetical protein
MDPEDLELDSEPDIEYDAADEETSSELVPVDSADLALPSGPSVEEEIARVSGELARLTEEAAALVAEGAHPDEPSTALVPSGGQNPAHAKTSMAQLRSKVARKQQEIAQKSEEMQALLKEQMSVAREAMAPLQKMIKELEEGIWTVNLYLGRDEQILLLQDGEPAPADEPLVVRQLVLAMDEECAVAAEDGGIDAISIEHFDAWLTEDPAHLDQVLPEQKGVVALVPRWNPKSYKDPWMSGQIEDMNKQTYFLIRNGGKVYRTWTDFEAGKRLIPTSDEFTSFFFDDYAGGFRVKTKTPLQPGTQAWFKAEERADARRRHYMRVALILQGLIDRTTVFQPLPEAGLGFLDDAHYKAGRVRFITDAEKTLGTGKDSFRRWQARLNKELRPGMRIVGAFDSQDFKSYRYERRQGHERITPYGVNDYPETGTLYTLDERRPDGGFVIRYARQQEIYDPKAWVESPDRPGWGHYGEYRKPKTRASCVVYAHDSFVIPYDLASVADMQSFLRSRAERHDYVDMFPILKAAIKAKRQEAREEEPFRVMLAGVLARESGVTVAEAEEAVATLVDWWKFTNNQHRPLVGDEQEQRKAVRAIIAEHKRRLKDAEKGPADQKLVATLKREHKNAVLVARKRDGRYVVLTPAADADVFVHEHEYDRRGQLVAESQWKLAPLSRTSRWTPLYASERWAGWQQSETLKERLTQPEKEVLAAQIVKDEESEDGRLLAVTYSEKDRVFNVWRYLKDAQVDEERPLSGKHEEPDISGKIRRWRRTTGNRVVLEEPGWYGYGFDLGHKTPWERHEDELFHLDAKLLAKAEKEHARVRKVIDKMHDLQQKARQLIVAIQDAWLERAEQEAHARFLEDYHDETLWEGHRKGLKIQYPHHSTREGNTFENMVRGLVEQHARLGGLTVQAAAEKAGVDPAKLPADILEFVFPTGQELAKSRR